MGSQDILDLALLVLVRTVFILALSVPQEVLAILCPTEGGPHHTIVVRALIQRKDSQRSSLVRLVCNIGRVADLAKVGARALSVLRYSNLGLWR